MADYPRALTLHQRRAAVNTLPGNQLFKIGTVDQWMALGMIDPLAVSKYRLVGYHYA